MYRRFFRKRRKERIQQLLRRASRPAPVQLSEDTSHSEILQLQRKLGNQRVAQLIRGGLLSPYGKVIRFQPKLNTGPVRIQRRLIVSGSSEALVNEYLTLVGNAAGLRLNWAFAQPRVAVGGNLPGPVPSPDARSNIVRVINHATQHAELHIGTNQPRVSVGAFPGAGSTIQTIDMDDIRNINASLPGQGTAKAFHE